MTIEAVDGDLGLDPVIQSDPSSSTWNGREVQCRPLDEYEVEIRALAFVHLAAQELGPQVVRKLEQEIYKINIMEDDGEDEGDDSDELLDQLLDIVRSDPCAVTPEVLKSEERIKVLLNDPTRFKKDLIVLYKSKGFWKKTAKVFRETGHATTKAVRETGRGVREKVHDVKEWAVEHKKELIIGTVVAAGVALTILTAGAGASGAVAAAGAAGAASGAVADKSRRRDEDKEKSSPDPIAQTSSPPPPSSATTLPSLLNDRPIMPPTFQSQALTMNPPSSMNPSYFNASDYHSLVRPSQPAQFEYTIPQHPQWNPEKQFSNHHPSSTPAIPSYAPLAQATASPHAPTKLENPIAAPPFSNKASSQETRGVPSSKKDSLSKEPSLGAYFVSDTLHGLYDIYGEARAEGAQLVDWVNKIAPLSPHNPEQKSRKEQVLEETQAGHAVIDEHFNTHLAVKYTPDYKSPVLKLEMPFLPAGGISALAGRVGSIGALEGSATRAGAAAAEALEGATAARGAAAIEQELITVSRAASAESNISSLASNVLKRPNTATSPIRVQPNGIWEIESANIKKFDFQGVVRDEVKMDHLFKPIHQLDKLNSPKEAILKKITQAIVDADMAGKIVQKQPFEIRVLVEGYEVEVRGIVIDGELRYGTFFVPK